MGVGGSTDQCYNTDAGDCSAYVTAPPAVSVASGAITEARLDGLLPWMMQTYYDSGSHQDTGTNPWGNDGQDFTQAVASVQNQQNWWDVGNPGYFSNGNLIRMLMIMPPQLKTINTINDSTPSSGQAQSGQYGTMANPLAAFAGVVQEAMFGTDGAGNWPCQKDYVVPVALGISDLGFNFNVVLTGTVPNPGYNACKASLASSLSTPQQSGGSQGGFHCVGGDVYPTLGYIDSFKGTMWQFEPDWTKWILQSGTYDSGPLWAGFNSTGGSFADLQAAGVFKPSDSGPIDIKTGKPCGTGDNNPNCTWNICMSGHGGSKTFNCVQGQCQPVDEGAGMFDSLGDCLTCSTSVAGCGTDGVCCSASNYNNGTCPTSNGPTTNLVIPIILFLVLAVLLIVVFAKKRREHASVSVTPAPPSVSVKK